MITQLPWPKIFSFGIKAIIALAILLIISGCFYFLIKFLVAKIENIRKNSEQKLNQKNKKVLLEEKRKEWLLGSFNINNLPKKVDLELMPESSSPVHKFVIGFWRAKSKVCKPYSK
jgi:predicted membrane protein